MWGMGGMEAGINIDTGFKYSSRLVNLSVLTAHPFKYTFSKADTFADQ
jgi:hypothetical protein